MVAAVLESYFEFVNTFTNKHRHLCYSIIIVPLDYQIRFNLPLVNAAAVILPVRKYVFFHSPTIFILWQVKTC
jgi:hypothetical protein